MKLRCKKYKLIYNPEAGDTSFKGKLDTVIAKFQQELIQIVPYRTFSADDAEKAVAEMEGEEYQGLLVSGGDGTINRVVNGLLKKGLDLPLGIFPSGTANDFASSLRLPRKVEEACDLIIFGKVAEVDVGQAKDKYFINVLSGGLMSEISHKVDINLKHSLGKIAYYLKGFGQLPKFSSFPLQIKSAECNFEGNAFLFLVLNSAIAGGFRNIAPLARINDGLLDVIIVKGCSIPEFATLFLRVLQGAHINSPHLEYFQTKGLEIVCGDLQQTEVDGEIGPQAPFSVNIFPRKLKVWVP